MTEMPLLHVYPLNISFSLYKSYVFTGFNFDLSPLKKNGESYKVTNDKEFDFLLNVCGPVNGTKCDSSGITGPGICQVKKDQSHR